MRVDVVFSMLGHTHWQLPAGLNSLELQFDSLCAGREDILPAHCPVKGFGLGKLANLQQLGFKISLNTLSELCGNVDALEALTHLTCIELEYEGLGSAHTDCGLWGRLPALRSLIVWDWEDSESNGWDPDAAAEVLAGIQRSSALTKLDVELKISEEDQGMPMGVCGYLSGLTRLQHLELFVSNGLIAERDCMHLSSLRSLEHLSLQHMEGAVGDAAAVTLALNMPKLQCLNLQNCALRSDAVLGVAAQLPGLTSLDVSDNDGFTQQALANLRKFNSCGHPSISDMLLRPQRG